MKKYKLIKLFILSFLFFFSTPSLAEDEGIFFVKPIIPQNQIPSTTEYYHLQTDTDLKQDIELVIVNESSEKKVFELNILDGMTTEFGEISYSNEHIYDKSQKIKLSDHINFDKKQVVEANESKIIKLTINLPIEDFKGQLLGAINVAEYSEVNKESEGVINKFTYNLPIKIDVKTSQIQAKLNYDGLDVENSEILKLYYINSSSTIIRDLKITYEIFSENNNKSIWKKEIKQLELAPTSQYIPALSIKDAKLKSGKYTIEIRAVSDVSSINEVWNDTFTISLKDNVITGEGIEVVKNNIMWFVLGVLLVIIISVITIIKQKKKTVKRSKRKKR